jgi:hypothetical protein
MTRKVTIGAHTYAECSIRLTEPSINKIMNEAILCCNNAHAMELIIRQAGLKMTREYWSAFWTKLEICCENM